MSAPIAGRPCALQVGDTVSIPVLAWGPDWAKANYPETWRTATFQGTVLEKRPGGKWLCDFQEEDPSERGSFLRKALTFISRPCPAEGVGPTKAASARQRTAVQRTTAAADSSDDAAGAADSSDEEAVAPAQDTPGGILYVEAAEAATGSQEANEVGMAAKQHRGTAKPAARARKAPTVRVDRLQGLMPHTHVVAVASFMPHHFLAPTIRPNAGSGAAGGGSKKRGKGAAQGAEDTPPAKKKKKGEVTEDGDSRSKSGGAKKVGGGNESMKAVVEKLAAMEEERKELEARAPSLPNTHSPFTQPIDPDRVG